MLINRRPLCKYLAVIVASLTFSTICYAQDKQQWIQLNAAPLNSSYSVQFKHIENRSGWSVGMSVFEKDSFLTSTVDRSNQESIDPQVRVLEASKLWSIPFRSGFADFGVGLGVAQGEWSNNCSASAPSSILPVNECDIKNVSTVGIPLQASITLGRYAGIGLGFNYFMSSERSYSLLSLTVPLGNFTR